MTYTPTVWVDGDCVMAADMNNIENGVDRAQGDIMILRGLLAAIPATDPLLVGRLYFATDTSELFRDNGAGWDQIIFDHGDQAGLLDNDHPQYIQDIEFAALGDILVGTGAGTFGNLGIGAGATVLTSVGGTAAWAAPAGAGAWTRIAETVLGAPAAQITFGAGGTLPQTYRTLCLIWNGKSDNTGGADRIIWRGNGDSGNNYAWGELRGGGQFTNAQSGADSSARVGELSESNAPTPDEEQSGGVFYWHDYTDTTWWKFGQGTSAVLSLIHSNRRVVSQVGGGWLNTAALNQIDLLPLNGANFAANSRFALYGIN